MGIGEVTLPPLYDRPPRPLAMARWTVTQFLVAGGRTVVGGDRFHTLHHRYFDCNYGTAIVPLDKWLGTFHDGSEAATELVKQRRRRLAAR